MCDQLSRDLNREVPCAAIHGDKSQQALGTDSPALAPARPLIRHFGRAFYDTVAAVVPTWDDRLIDALGLTVRRPLDMPPSTGRLSMAACRWRHVDGGMSMTVWGCSVFDGGLPAVRLRCATDGWATGLSITRMLGNGPARRSLTCLVVGLPCMLRGGWSNDRSDCQGVGSSHSLPVRPGGSK